MLRKKLFLKRPKKWANVMEKMRYLYSVRLTNLLGYKIFFLEHVVRVLPKAIQSAYIFKSNISITIDSSCLLQVLQYLRDHTNMQFKTLIDITCVDFPDKKKRFKVIYNLLSLRFNSRIRICVELSENEPVTSVVNLFPNANWLEREIWDMYGVFFTNHPDLRRILTDYGFEGFPLRKDFPLMGFVEVRYDVEKKAIVYEPVELTQQYRSFNFTNPWESFVNKKVSGIDIFNIMFRMNK